MSSLAESRNDTTSQSVQLEMSTKGSTLWHIILYAPRVALMAFVMLCTARGRTHLARSLAEVGPKGQYAVLIMLFVSVASISVLIEIGKWIVSRL